MKNHPFRLILTQKIAISVLALSMMAACNVHEWPTEDPAPQPEPVPEPETPAFVLHLDFDTDLPLYQEVEWSRAASDPHDVRYQLFVYQGTEDISPSLIPIKTLTFTDISSTLNRDVELDLEAGNYSFLVWVDYVDSGSSADKYYSTGTLSAITLANKDLHPGSNPYRDAFRGQAVGTVDKTTGGSVTVAMKRPMARFEFITTDLDNFMARMAARGADSRADVSEYTVTFNYTFMPSTYNIYTDKPTDSWGGTKFDSSFEALDEGTRMGYDYVFVNGSESLVNLSVQVKDQNGNVVAATNSIEVPLVRSKLTVVKGEFMSSTSGGVSIDPGYEGDYNIEIR